MNSPPKEGIGTRERGRLEAIDPRSQTRLFSLAQALVDAITEILQSSAAVRTYSSQLDNFVPTGLAPGSVESRLGGRLAEALAKVSPHKAQLGGLGFRGVGGIYSKETDWAEAEVETMRPQLEALTKESEDD